MLASSCCPSILVSMISGIAIGLVEVMLMDFAKKCLC